MIIFYVMGFMIFVAVALCIATYQIASYGRLHAASPATIIMVCCIMGAISTFMLMLSTRDWSDRCHDLGGQVYEKGSSFVCVRGGETLDP